MGKRTGTLALAILAVVLAVPAYWLLFTTLMAHDDEGYVLITLKNYADHGGLYSHVFSQYGPFFYFLHDLGHRIFRYEFTNTTARLITLGCWLVASVACADLVWKQTRTWLLAGTTLLLTFVYLLLMVSEPIHPGGLITALVALAAWGGAELIRHRATGGLAILAGVVGAALVLTKINVGVFFILGAGAWFVLHLPSAPQARTGTIVAGIALAILPFALMTAELDKPWAQQFAVLSSIASVTLIIAAWRERSDLTQWKFAGYGLVAAIVLGTVSIACVCTRGTSLAEILNGVVLSPLRQPGIYHYAPDWKPGSIGVAIASLGLVLVHQFVPRISTAGILAGARILIAIYLGLAACDWLPFSLHSSVMSYVLPLSWIFVVTLTPGETLRRSPVTQWIGLLLLLQYLHAYPVAGSQIAWGTFLAVPVVALGLHDALAWLTTRKPTPLTWIIPAACGLLSLASVVQLSSIGWHRYQESPPLSLPGAENVRPPGDFSTDLRMLSLNAVAHGDVLFSLPGMFSFNLWTQLPTPTFNDTTHWFTLLNPQQQQEIADALTRSARPVVIVHQGMLAFLAAGHFNVTSPLHDYLDRNFSRAFKIGEFEFWVRRGRQIVPIGTAEFLRLNNPSAGLPANKLELVVTLPAGEKIARFELVTRGERPVVLHSWSSTDGALHYTAINLEGRALAPESDQGWSNSLPSLIRLDLALPNGDVPDRKNSLILVKNAGGKTLAEAQFVE